MTLQIPQLVHDFLKHLSNQKSCSPLTIKAYKKDLEQAFTSATMKAEDLLATARKAQSAWSPLTHASRNRKTATLKSFFGWLYDGRIIEKPLADLLVGPKVPKKIPDFISVDEVLSVISYFENFKCLDQKTGTQNQKELSLFLLLYGAGLRISEACALKWSAVNLQSRSVRVTGKGDKERIVILPQFCAEKISELKKLAPSTFVFGDVALNSRTGYEWIRQIGKKCGLLHSLHPHSLRHSFATHMLASGANLRTLQKLLGHESLQATEKYTHLNVDQLARTMESKHPLSKFKLDEN